MSALSICAICISFIWLVCFIGDSKIIQMQIQTMWHCIEPPTLTINTWACLCLSFVSSVWKETSIWKRKVMDGNNHDHKNEPSNVLRSLMKNKGSFVRYVLYSVSFSFQLQISCIFQLINLFIYCLWHNNTRGVTMSKMKPTGSWLRAGIDWN